MLHQLTVNLSEETYQGLMNLVGEKNTDQFIEQILRDKLESQTEFKVVIPKNNGKNKVYIRSPHLAKSIDLRMTEEE